MGRAPGSRYLLFALFGLAWIAVLAVGLSLLAPAILATGPGRHLFERFVDSRIAGSLSVEALSLSWRGKQRVEGLTLRGAGGEEILVIGSMSNDRSLLHLLLHGRDDLGTTAVEGLRASLAADASGRTNLMAALQSPRPPGSPGKGGPGFIPILPFGSLSLGASLVTVDAPGIETVRFDVSSLALDLPAPGKPLRVSFASATRQGDLAGEIRVDGTVEDAVDEGGRMQAGAAKIDVTVEARNLPVEGIDGALGYRGRLAAALGRQADVAARTRASLDGVQVDVEARSPNLEAKFGTVLRGTDLVLREEAPVRLFLTPALARALAPPGKGGAAYGLREEVPLAIRLAALRIPVVGFSAGRLGVKVLCSAGGPLRLAGPGLEGPLAVEGLEASFEAAALGGESRFALAADFAAAGGRGRAAAAGTISRLVDGRGRLDPGGAGFAVEGVLTHVPAALAGRYLRGGLDPGDLTGPFVDVKFSGSRPPGGATEVTFSLRGTDFSLDAGLRLGKTVELTGPAVLKAGVTPRFVKSLSPGAAKIDLLGTTSVEVSLTRLSFAPGGGKGGAGAASLAGFEATVSVPRLELGVPTVGSLVAEKASLALSSASPEAVDWALKAAVILRDGGGRYALVAGKDPLALDIGGRASFGAAEGLGKLTAAGSLSNEAVSASLALALERPFETLSVVEPLGITWTAPPGTFGTHAGAAASYGVRGAPGLSLGVEPFAVPLKGFSLEKVSLSSKGSVPSVEVGRGDRTDAVLRDIAFRADFSGPRGGLTVSAKASASVPGRQGEHAVEGSLALERLLAGGRLNTAGADLSLSFGGKAIPTALAGIFTAAAPKLEALAGESADVSGALRLAPLAGGRGEGSLSIRAERMGLQAGFALDDGVTLKAPADFTVTLTPRSYGLLTTPADGGGRERRLSLQEPTLLSGRLASLRLPRGGGGKAFEASVKTGSLLFKDLETGRPVGLRDLAVEARTADLARGLAVSVSAAVAGGDEGTLKAEAALADLFGEDGRLDLPGVTLNLDVRAERVPTSLIDDWMGLGGKGVAALGDSVSLTAKSLLKKGAGPLVVKARATGGELDVDGVVRDGVFTMSAPAEGRLEVTETLGRELLSKVHPFFETVYTSREPLRLQVPYEGFSVPLKNFDIAAAVVPRIVLGSNRLVLRKGGSLKMLIDVAQQFGGMKGVGAAEDVEVWFTPLIAELRGGVFRYTSRLDLLVDGRLHAVSWGSVALGAGGSRYSLKVGLPADALRKVLGTKRVGEGEIFTIPLEGREGGLDLKATLSKATLDLGRARGQFELSQKDPLLGLVAGELARKVIGTETGVVPPPSVSPLPWAEPPEPAPEPPPPAGEPPAQGSAPETGAPRDGAGERQTPEDPLRKVLPKDLKGIFDILTK